MTMENVDGVEEAREGLANLGSNVQRRATTAAAEAMALARQLEALGQESRIVEVGARAAQQGISDEIGEVSEAANTATEEANQLSAVITGTVPTVTTDETDNATESENNDDSVVTVPPPPPAPTPDQTLAIVTHPRDWSVLAWVLAILAGLMTLRFIVMPYSGAWSETLLTSDAPMWALTVGQWVSGFVVTGFGWYIGGSVGTWLNDKFLS